MNLLTAEAVQERTQPRTRPLRVAYAIQNVGGIDFRQDIGDTVPVRQTLLGLQRAGHDVDCFILHGRVVYRYANISALEQRRTVVQGISGRAPFRLFESGVRRAQATFRLPYLALFDSFRFYEVARRAFGAYDLCHEHNGLFSVGAALACRRLDLPYVLTVSADPLFERRMLGRPLRGVARLVAAREAAFTYRLARRILCVSEPAKRNLVETWQLDPQEVVVMPNGVDTALFSPDYDPRPVRERWRLGGRPVVAFVGGFQPWHGLDLLVESMVRVRAAVPEAMLLLVGDGRARPLVDEAIAQHGLETAVIVTGFVPQEEVPQLLAAADVAVAPYPRLPGELWFSPLKIYEYMAAGKAIVATRAGQIKDAIADGQTGLLTEPGDVPQLAQAIVHLLQNGAERERLGRAARQQAVGHQSWEQYVGRLEGVYESALR